ncbi:MAG TPA: S1/P1 nuclease [Thermoanaerobaculia bacterium]
MKRAPTLLFALLLAAPTTAFAWGPNGHRIVGRIAANHLTAEAARAVECLIGPESLAQVSTWPDEIRSDPAWKKADPWHFLSIDDNETLETTERNPAGDVLEAMQRFEAVLRDPQAAPQAKREALKFLVHFVGDVHQPLHVGRRADFGGNRVNVIWFGEETNLHSVWDSGLIENEKLSFSELVEFIDHPTWEEIKTWQGSPYSVWVQESKDLRNRVYQLGDSKLSYQYAYDHIPVIKRRLLQAGVRLAGLLNAVFAGSAPSIPDRE